VNSGDLNFVVGRIVFDAVGDGVLDVWFNIPLSATEGTIGPADSTVAVASGSFTLGDIFQVRMGNNHEGVFDEVRLGEALEDVIPIPEPSCLLLLGVVLVVGCFASGNRRQR